MWDQRLFDSIERHPWWWTLGIVCVMLASVMFTK